MSFRQDQVFSYALPSSTTLGSLIDIGQGWRQVFLEIPTMNTVADIYLHASPTSGGTFTRITENAGAFRKTYKKTMASNTTLTGQFDLEGPWDQIWFDKPTFNTNTAVFFHAAIASGGTFSRVAYPYLYTGTVQTNDWAVQSGVSARLIPIPIGFRYVKIEFGSAVTDTTFPLELHCLNTNIPMFRDFVIPSGTSGRIVPIPNPAQYLKIELSTAHTSTVTFNVICKG